MGAGTWFSLIGMLLAVALVIGLAYWFTRHVAGGTGLGGAFGSFRGTRRLKVLTQLAVGKEQRLIVTKVGERYFLLGVTPQNISSLAELSREEVQPWIDQDEPEDSDDPDSWSKGEGGRLGFGDAFRKALKDRVQR